MSTRSVKRTGLSVLTVVLIALLASISEAKVFDRAVLAGGGFNVLSTQSLPFDYLDPGFGSGGVVVTPITDATNLYDEPNAIQVQPDGKIVVCGMVYYSDDESGYPVSFFIARYNQAGGLDESFGTGGKVVAPLGGSSGGTYVGHSIALQADGKIVAVGYWFGHGSSVAVQRYNPDGTLDALFGPGGTVLTAGTGGAYDVAVQPDDKIVVSGHANVGGEDNNFAVVRYNPNGSLDGSFGSGGKAITPVGAGNVVDQSYAVGLQPDGKIVVVGTSLIIGSANSYDMALVRYNGDGTLDSTFGTNGRIINPAPGYSIASDVVVQPDGRIVVVAGGRFGPGTTEIVRYNPDGSPDTSFAANGTFAMDYSFFSGRGIALQPDGKIVAFGGGRDAESSPFAFAAMRLNRNGTPDDSFGSNGRVLTPIGINNGSGAIAGALQSDGKLLAFGGTSGNEDIALIRYLTNSQVSIAGRVTTVDGRGMPNVTVLITNANGERRRVTTTSHGFYSFENLSAGGTYTLLPISKKYRFEPRTLKIDASLTHENFVGGI